MSISTDVASEYRISLEDLTMNSKPRINMLTMVAEDNLQYADEIVNVIENHIKTVDVSSMLPALYLIDSIIKNVAKDYIALFSPKIISIFCFIFSNANEAIRLNMYKLRNTWGTIFDDKILFELDIEVSKIDYAWPHASDQRQIHLNPKFLNNSQTKEPDPAQSHALKGSKSSVQVIETKKTVIKELPKLEQVPSDPRLRHKRVNNLSTADDKSKAISIIKEQINHKLKSLKKKEKLEQQILPCTNSNTKKSEIITEHIQSNGRIRSSKLKRESEKTAIPKEVTKEEIVLKVENVPESQSNRDVDLRVFPSQQPLSQAESTNELFGTKDHDIRVECRTWSQYKSDCPADSPGSPLSPGVMTPPEGSGRDPRVRSGSRLNAGTPSAVSMDVDMRKADVDLRPKFPAPNMGGDVDYRWGGKQPGTEAVWKQECDQGSWLQGDMCSPRSHPTPPAFLAEPQHRPPLRPVASEPIRLPPIPPPPTQQPSLQFFQLNPPLCLGSTLPPSMPPPLFTACPPPHLPFPPDLPPPAELPPHHLLQHPPHTRPLLFQQHPPPLLAQRPLLQQNPPPHFQTSIPPPLFRPLPPAPLPTSKAKAPPPIDIKALYNKLVHSGMITHAEKKNPPIKAEKKNPPIKAEKKNPPIKAEKTTPIELTLKSLREKRQNLISQLYSGRQCSSCALRLRDKTLYKEHLDWHFRTNRREKNSQKRAFFRAWFYSKEDWTQFTEVNDPEEERQPCFFEEHEMESPEPVELPTVKAPVEDGENVCSTCGERFDVVWKEELEEWHLSNALHDSDLYFHPLCLEDYKSEVERSKMSATAPSSEEAQEPFPTNENKMEEPMDTENTDPEEPTDSVKAEPEEPAAIVKTEPMEVDNAEEESPAPTMGTEAMPDEEPLPIMEETEFVIEMAVEDTESPEHSEEVEAENRVVLGTGGLKFRLRPESIVQPPTSPPTQQQPIIVEEEEPGVEFSPPPSDPRFPQCRPVYRGKEETALCSIM